VTEAGRSRTSVHIVRSMPLGLEAIGVSRAFFYVQVMPELRVARVGRKRLIPVSELERWLDKSASRAI
jgi:hypothetical protein